MPGAFLLSAPVILLFGGARWLSLLTLGWLTGDLRPILGMTKGPWSTYSACCGRSDCAGRGVHRRGSSSESIVGLRTVGLAAERSRTKSRALALIASRYRHVLAWCILAVGFPGVGAFHRSAMLAGNGQTRHLCSTRFCAGNIAARAMAARALHTMAGPAAFQFVPAHTASYRFLDPICHNCCRHTAWLVRPQQRSFTHCLWLGVAATSVGRGHVQFHPIGQANVALLWAVDSTHLDPKDCWPHLGK